MDAVVRNLEIIGESVKNLPPEIRQLRPQVPWTRIAGLRDLLIHGYFGVDAEILWQIATAKVPELTCEVRQLLSELDTPPNGGEKQEMA